MIRRLDSKSVGLHLQDKLLHLSTHPKKQLRLAKSCWTRAKSPCCPQSQILKLHSHDQRKWPMAANLRTYLPNNNIFNKCSSLSPLSIVDKKLKRRTFSAPTLEIYFKQNENWKLILLSSSHHDSGITATKRKGEEHYFCTVQPIKCMIK